MHVENGTCIEFGNPVESWKEYFWKNLYSIGNRGVKDLWDVDIGELDTTYPHIRLPLLILHRNILSVVFITPPPLAGE